MTRGTRRRLFYLFLILFVAVGISVILYAEGLRLDFENFTTQTVGAVYVESFPGNASISLNGKPFPNQASFLNHGTFISDLYPKTYTLALSADGYDAWHEDANVAASLVTTFKYAVLVPRTGINVATSENVSSFFESGGALITDDTNKTIRWTTTGSTASGTIGNGTLVDHSPTLDRLIYRSSQGTYYFYSTESDVSLNLTALLTQNGVNIPAIQHIAIDPYDPDTTFVITASRLWNVNAAIGRATSTAIATGGRTMEPQLGIGQNLLAWAEADSASGTSKIFVYNTLSGNVTNNSLVIPGSATQLTWINGDLLGVLQSDGELFSYRPSTGAFSKIADDVKSFSPTPDGTMIAALEHSAIEVFAMTGTAYYRFALPNMDSANSLSWYKDETHLFVQYPDHVSFLDLEDTDLKNLTTVSLGTASFYDAGENSLYLIDQGNKLIRFDFPQ